MTILRIAVAVAGLAAFAAAPALAGGDCQSYGGQSHKTTAETSTPQPSTGS